MVLKKSLMAPRAAQGDLDQGNAKEIGTERRAAADTVLEAEIESTGNVAVTVIDIMKNGTGTEIGNGIEKGKESTDVTDERERESEWKEQEENIHPAKEINVKISSTMFLP